jgi:hypothetical protein
MVQGWELPYLSKAVGDFDATLDALKQRSLDAKASFVNAELELGLTFCKLANGRENGNERFAHRIENARKALETAEKYMWDLRMNHSVFDRMTALAERLRFELDILSNRTAKDAHRPQTGSIGSDTSKE